MSSIELRDAADRILPATFLSTAALADRGFGRYRIACLVADGRLLRLRKGKYLSEDAHPDLVAAGRLGGRLDCVSLLSAVGIFVREKVAGMHLQFTPGTTRLPRRPPAVTAHWRHTQQPPAALAANLNEALAQACRCLSPRDAVAALDSAWHHGLIDEADLAEIFARLPHRFRSLRRLLDPRSESGAETLMRLLLRGLGCHVEVQVKIAGVGRVDLVVDGWLIVECDSKAYHEGWSAQKRDRRRDLAAAALGYTTVRPLAEDIYYRYDDVLATMKAIIARAHLRNSTDLGGREPRTASSRASRC